LKKKKLFLQKDKKKVFLVKKSKKLSVIIVKNQMLNVKLKNLKSCCIKIFVKGKLFCQKNLNVKLLKIFGKATYNFTFLTICFLYAVLILERLGLIRICEN
jgi:hypothetical protein